MCQQAVRTQAVQLHGTRGRHTERNHPSSSYLCPFFQLNASDDRGIGIVRGQILNFASTRTIFHSGFKLIILDEADAMTKDAQNALRRGAV